MKLNKKLGVFIGILIIIIILLAAVILSKSTYFKEKVLKGIYNAEIENDIDYLVNYMEMTDGEKFTKEELKTVLDMIKEENFRLNSFNYPNNHLDDMGKNGSSIYPIYTVKKGKDKILFDDYKILFRYYDLVLNIDTTTEKEMTFLLNGKKIENPKVINNQLLIRNLKPGKYKLEIVLGENNENNRNYIKEFELLSFNEKNTNADIYMEDNRNKNNIIIEEYIEIIENYVMVNSYIDKTIGNSYLYINNEKTDIIIDDTEYFYGPIYDGEELDISVGIDIDGGVLRTSSVNTNYIDFDLGIWDSAINFDTFNLYLDEDEYYSYEDLEGLLYSYMYDLVAAINTGNKVYLKNTIKEGSPLYKKQTDLVDNLRKNETYEEFLGCNIESIKKIDNKNYDIVINEFHKIYFKDGQTKNTDNTWVYRVNIDGNGMKFSDLNSVK